MLHVPSPNPTVSRRRVLIGTAALALLGASVAACGSSEPPPEVDELNGTLREHGLVQGSTSDAIDSEYSRSTQVFDELNGTNTSSN